MAGGSREGSLSPGSKRRTKPYFLRKLPSRVEMLEGQTFSFACHYGHGGCAPWFVKKLPQKLEVPEKNGVHVDVAVNKTERTDEVVSELTTTATTTKVRTETSMTGQKQTSRLVQHTHMTGNHAAYPQRAHGL